MRRNNLFNVVSLVAAVAALSWVLAGATALGSQASVGGDFQWKYNDRSRPLPPVITPGEESTQDHVGKAPSDATVLFDGKDLSAWRMSATGGPPLWKVEKGYFVVVPGSGYMETKQSFGDCQLHVEWATPNPPRGHDQDRGNSGVFLAGNFEVQVLDSYENITYADGQAAAIYGEYPPQVNASRRPGEWQIYDIIFHGPRFDANGKITRLANFTVFHNGVLVQDHVALHRGPTDGSSPYKPIPTKLPVKLQDHNHPVRFRNIWIREIPDVQK
jgi:hypothetical protein